MLEMFASLLTTADWVVVGKMEQFCIVQKHCKNRDRLNPKEDKMGISTERERNLKFDISDETHSLETHS